MKRKWLLAALPLVILITSAQIFGPPVFTPFLTIGTGTKVSGNGNLQVNGDCSGCADTGTIEVNFPALSMCTTQQTLTVAYQILDDRVTLSPVDDVSCTCSGCSTTSVESDALASKFIPAREQYLFGQRVQDNSTQVEACFAIETNGKIRIKRGTQPSSSNLGACGSTSWISTGSRALYWSTMSGSYLLN